MGCSKNTFDSEVLMGQLKANDKEVVHEDKGNIVVVNTCGFIENAKEESVNMILNQIQKKQRGASSYLQKFQTNQEALLQQSLLLLQSLYSRLFFLRASFPY